MKKLVFHVGAHRTATTFLQRTLKRNSTALTEQGISYVPMNPDVAKAIDPHNAGAADTADVARRMAALWPDDASTVLMSWEAMIGLPYQGGSLYGERRRFLSILAQAAAISGRELSTVLTFRRQDDFLNSYYGLMIKAGYVITPDEFKARFDIAHLSWGDIFADLQEIGNASAVPFEICRTSTEQYIGHVVAPTGITPTALRLTEPPANEGFGKVALALTAYLNEHAQMDAAARAGFRKLATRLTGGDEKADIFSQSERDLIVSQCVRGNEDILSTSEAPHAVRPYYQPSFSPPTNRELCK